jgi:hypothetical protein
MARLGDSPGVTSLDEIPNLFAAQDAAPVPTPRRHRHQWEPRWQGLDTEAAFVIMACRFCPAIRDETKARRGRNNRKRGGDAELTAARVVNGRKMGPLGLPWDVEMPGYARLQVRKYVTPESLRKIAAELSRIGSGAEMPGYIWIEPGRGGERLIVFRLADFAERHGVPTEGDE